MQDFPQSAQVELAYILTFPQRFEDLLSLKTPPSWVSDRKVDIAASFIAATMALQAV